MTQGKGATTYREGQLPVTEKAQKVTAPVAAPVMAPVPAVPTVKAQKRAKRLKLPKARK